MGTSEASAKARKMVSEGAALIDVRTPEEYREGHIEGARNIPVQQFAERMSEVGPPDRPVVVYCRSGGRSQTAAEMLRRAGYQEVFNLGPMAAW